MYFQIKEIILWPKILHLQPRRVSFQTGKVNVITGASRTGKSAIIPIIDYCLGAEKCTIPVKTIRDHTSWFGVLVQSAGGEKLFARREPGNQRSTGDMFVLEGPTIDVPEVIQEKNANVEFVKHSLDELAGLTDLDFSADTATSWFKGRPSFRDLGAFIFQPQNVVANPDILFYKADTYDHREKLKTIFPYVLNAITAQVLAKQHELSQLRKELRRKQAELATVTEVSQRWLAEIQSKVSEAKELGLVTEADVANASKEQLVDILSGIVEATQYDIRVTTATISDAVQELVQLQKEEAEISLELSSLRKRLAEMSALRESTVLYKGALQVQRDRLKISEWLGGIYDPKHNCPVCGNHLNSQSENLRVLQNSLREIENTIGEFGAVPAAFDREQQRVRNDIQTLTEKLKGTRIRSEALQKTSEEAKRQQYDSLAVSRFVGNLEQALETYTRLGADSELEKEVDDLRRRVGELEREISESEIQARLKRALEAVSLNAERLMPELDSERPNDPISISIEDLTIKIGGVEREDYLWEIGSGSNWLSYHVAITLGLQQFFLRLRTSPVPSFIVYDQPSQVWFPKKMATNGDPSELDPPLMDEDIEAVQKVFRVFATVVEQEMGNLQIIVLDHAAENVWGRFKELHLVEEWRGGTKLVPMEWIEAAAK